MHTRLKIPPDVFIRPGNTKATFTIEAALTLEPLDFPLTASYGSNSKSAELRVIPEPPLERFVGTWTQAFPFPNVLDWGRAVIERDGDDLVVQLSFPRLLFAACPNSLEEARVPVSEVDDGMLSLTLSGEDCSGPFEMRVKAEQAFWCDAENGDILGLTHGMELESSWTARPDFIGQLCKE